MTEVLKALQELNVYWKKIGHYNMKCRWVPGASGHGEGAVNNSMHDNNYFEDESSIIEHGVNIKPQNVVKFEVQVTFYFPRLSLSESWHHNMSNSIWINPVLCPQHLSYFQKMFSF